MSPEILARSGAIISSIGVGLLVIFVIILLAFPVIKNCGENGRCTYHSTAPGTLQSVIQPGFLAISLLTISAGVLVLRLGRWLEAKRQERSNRH
ncbi:MAG: hypothetical protein M3115_07130 [Thermoproteota archaeon]|nr:hypothetical protein [Thermoproteota archaeon]